MVEPLSTVRRIVTLTIVPRSGTSITRISLPVKIADHGTEMIMEVRSGDGLVSPPTAAR